MYIINFLLQKDVSFYLTMFHTTSTLGLGCGFIINSGLLFVDSNNLLFNKSTIGSVITVFLSILLLIFTIVKFTEAHSQQFSMTSMQMFGEGIISDDHDENYNNDGEEVAKNVRKQTLILKDIDNKEVDIFSNHDNAFFMIPQMKILKFYVQGKKMQMKL